MDGYPNTLLITVDFANQQLQDHSHVVEVPVDPLQGRSVNVLVNRTEKEVQMGLLLLQSRSVGGRVSRKVRVGLHVFPGGEESHALGNDRIHARISVPGYLDG